jgi:hypothetical protein
VKGGAKETSERTTRLRKQQARVVQGRRQARPSSARSRLRAAAVPRCGLRRSATGTWLQATPPSA